MSNPLNNMPSPLNNLERLEFSLSEIEKGLNFVGYVPGANIVSGGLRATIGQIQLIAGLAIGCFSFLASELATDPAKRAKFEAIANRAFEHAKHGIANIFRGIIESSAPFYAGGIAIWLSYDLHHYRLEYPGEVKAKEYFPPQEYTLSDLTSVSKELISAFE